LPDAGREQLWIDLWASADLVVGVHGSNMLLPTALARGAVILLPRERYANAFQDSLPNPELPEPRANLFALRTIYGGKGLKDVDASLVAGVACSLVSGRERFLAMERAAPIFADPAASAEDIARAMRSLERFRSPGGGGGGGRGGGAGA
jgi:hypothetical protein